MPDNILAHWKALVVIWLAICAVNAMPSPNGTGGTKSQWYKWLFTFLHTVTAGVPRILYTVAPSLSKYLPGPGNQTPNGGTNVTKA